MILYLGVPVAVNGAIIPRDVAERGRATVRIVRPAVVREVDPIGMSIPEDEVAAPKMPGHRVVLTVCLREVVLRFFAKENGIGRTRRPVAPESDMLVSLLLPAQIHRIHEIGVVE